MTLCKLEPRYLIVLLRYFDADGLSYREADVIEGMDFPEWKP